MTQTADMDNAAAQVILRSPRRQIEGMNSVAFDTLKFSKRLEEAGLTAAQAAGSAAAFAEATTELAANLATKQDLALLRHELKGDIAQLELRMTIKLGSMMAASIALTAALVRLL